MRMRKLLVLLTTVLGVSTAAQNHFFVGSLGYSIPSYDAIAGDAEVYSGGVSYYGFFENNFYFGTSYVYDQGEGLDCNFFPCLDASLEKTDIGLEIGYSFGKFTPYVSAYSTESIWNTTEYLRLFGRDREEGEMVDYGAGIWVDGREDMPNLWLRFSIDGFTKNKGVERSISGMGIYRLTRSLMVGAKFSLFVGDADQGSETALVLGWRF